jgi:Tol biopolymer transport system component
VISRRNDRPGYDLSLVDDTGAWAVILKNKEDLEVAWSPDGTYLLYSFFEPDQGVVLWLRSAETAAEASLGVQTSAGKCAWHPSGYVITCGVPDAGSFARNVPSGRTATIDSIDTYDFDNSLSVRRYSGTKSALIGVLNPFVSSSGDYFVFTNSFDSRLYMVPLE